MNALLEKLADDRGDQRGSVLRNLRRILNTRQGAAPAQPDLGTPPPGELLADGGAGLLHLQEALAEAIRVYEPRLAAVRVDAVPDQGLELRFAITGVLRDGRQTPFSCATAVDAAGKVVVQR